MALKTGLLGYWKLDETSGSLAEDAHSTNDGTNYNITSSSSGKITNCYSFNGSNSRVLLPAIACGNDKLSVSVWVMLTVAQSGDIIAVGKYWGQFRLGIRWGLLSAGVATINGEGDVANDTVDIGSASVFTHLVMVYDGATVSGSTIRLYVNGSEVTYINPSSLTGDLAQDSDPWEIGTHGNESMFWQGLIDELAIWNKALTSSEILELYNSGNGLSYDSWDIPQGGISGVISGLSSVSGDLGIVTQGGISGSISGLSSVSGSMLAKAYMSGYIAPSSQIVADHRAVDRYDLIPQYYVDEVKKMLVWVTGMSHSLGYQNGVNLLEVYDSTYQALTWLSDPPPSYSDQYLRLGRPWTSNVNVWLENLTDYESTIAGWASGGNPLSVLIYGWSYETTWNNAPGGGLDTAFDVHWAGDANGRWGLDAADEALTGNATCMDTYLAAVNTYNSYFVSNSLPTRMVFSTGPVDENGGTENGYQRELKHTHIRNYVNADSSRVLFDYADILVHNNSGVKYQVAWNDGGDLRYHDQIHPDNQLDYDGSWNIVDESDADGDHIGEVGALRLAKALWWMLARMAGWSDSVDSYVTGTLTEKAITEGLSGLSTGVSSVSGTLVGRGELCSLVLGGEEVENGSFNSETSWTYDQGSVCNIVNGVAHHFGVSGGWGVFQHSVYVVGLRYRVKYQILNHISGSLQLSGVPNSWRESNGLYSHIGIASSSTLGTAGVNIYADIDNISVKEVIDRHCKGVATVSGTLVTTGGEEPSAMNSSGVAYVSGFLSAKVFIAGSSAGGPTGGLYDLLTGLTAHWSFDETSGAYTDGAGSNDSVNIGSGVTRGQTGRIGNAAQFNGTANAFVLLPDSSDLQFGSSDVTFGCWFYTDGDYGQCGLFGGESGSFAIDTYSGRHLFLGNTLNAAYEFGNLTYNLNSWNFAVIVFNSALTTNNATLYLNGSSQTITANFNGTAGAATRIIGMDYLYGLPFTGLIDSPFIYKGRLLTAAEIAYLYNSGNGRPLSEFASGGVRGTLTEGVPATTLVGSSAGIASVAGDLSGPTNIEEIFAIVSTGSSVSGTMLAKARIYGVIGADQIIANHTVVDKYSDIPQQYIDEVKKMWLSYAGESHSEAIRTGLLALETAESKYAVVSTDYPPPQAYTDVNLRANRATWGDLNNASGWIYSYGEEDWYKSQTAINRTKAGLDYYHNTGPAMAAFGFGWCWDPAEDATDMAVYNSATQEYEDHCRTNGYLTKVFFTTGPVDGENASGVTGYNKYLAYEAIRNYASQNKNRILFDYADILCYDNDGSGPNTAEYNGHIYPIITTANVSPEQTGHISNVGALRLAKAMWWMLARMEGWQGESLQVSVTGTLTEKAITEGLSGLSTGVSSVSGTLRATGQIYTLSNGVALVGAILNGNGLLQGAISTNGTVSGLLLGLGRLAVSVNAIASVVGHLSSSGVFVGHIEGVASVSGQLSATANISASINATANVAGALKGNIIAASSGVSTVTGRILATANLVATSNGVSTCSATPILETQVGKTDGITLVSGTLIAKGSLSSQIIIDPIVLANLMGLVNISGISGGVSINYALLNGLYNISGLASGNSITYAALVSRNGLFGSIHGINTSTAILGGHGRLHSNISQGALSWADLAGTGFLSGSSLCSNIVSGSIREYVPPEELYGSIYSGSIVSGSIWNAGSVLRIFKGNVSIDGVKVSIADD